MKMVILINAKERQRLRPDTFEGGWSCTIGRAILVSLILSGCGGGPSLAPVTLAGHANREYGFRLHEPWKIVVTVGCATEPVQASWTETLEMKRSSASGDYVTVAVRLVDGAQGAQLVTGRFGTSVVARVRRGCLWKLTVPSIRVPIS